MSFGSDSESFLKYALSLPDLVGPDPETSDLLDHSSPSEQESVYQVITQNSMVHLTMIISINPPTSTLITPALMISVSYIPSNESFYSFASKASKAPELRPDDDSPGHPHLGPNGRLVDSERERRRVLGLCFYCGGEHMKVDCLKLQAHIGQNYDADDSESDIPGSDDGSE
ncbi:hypothetical protein EV368DRAFT_88971 [Lentinula lateritia]|nr:hypothetical protein EV368DRAFT_88971 [Lentinula lateritia]